MIWNTVLSIAEELGVTLRNTAYSEGVREGDDFANRAVRQERGDDRAGQFQPRPSWFDAVPWPSTCCAISRSRRCSPVIQSSSNDSFIGARPLPRHLSDHAGVPRSTAWSGSCAVPPTRSTWGARHQARRKSMVLRNPSREGLRILPVRFVRDGEIDPRHHEHRTRQCAYAGQGAPATCSPSIPPTSRLRPGLPVCSRTTATATVESAYETILTRSEAAMRDVLAKVPAGTYSFEDHMDDYGPGTEPIKMAVDITFDGRGEVEFDFSRSSDAVPAAINSYINYTRAYAVFAIKTFCQRARTADGRQHASDQAQSAGGLLLQSKISSTLRWPPDPPDPDFPIPSMVLSPRQCRSVRWVLFRIGRIPTSAASTIVPADPLSCTTYLWPAMAASTARTVWKA